MTNEPHDGGDRRGAREKVGDGIRQGIGVLSAFKDALEETIQEARERGDLSTDRAKEVMKGALGRAQAAASGAKERLDFAQQGDVDALREALDRLMERVSALEARLEDKEPP
jgi:polyhydroxyalkanoate synthesis regulator phasin